MEDISNLIQIETEEFDQEVYDLETNKLEADPYAGIGELPEGAEEYEGLKNNVNNSNVSIKFKI